jgi:hypothetical protein
MLVMAFQKAPNGFPPGYFVTVLQHGNDQWPFTLAAQRDHCRSVKLQVERRGRALQQACWQVVEFDQFRCGHVGPGVLVASGGGQDTAIDSTMKEQT